MDTRIITYYAFDRPDQYCQRGVYLPLPSITKETLLFVLKIEIEDLRPDQAINYCAFLNMISQTKDLDKIVSLSNRELKHVDININTRDNSVLFHRDNLLYLIAEIIAGDHSGSLLCTGDNKKGSKKLYEILILINNLLNLEENLHFLLLRNYLQYYNIGSVINYYSRWLKRYWYIYKDLLPDLDKSNKDKIEKGIKLFVKEVNVSLEEYFQIMCGLFSWFIWLPNPEFKNPEDSEKKGFNFKNIHTFYIDKRNFSDNYRLLNLLSKLAPNLDELKVKIQNLCKEDSQKNRAFDPIYQKLMKLFHHPVFRTDENIFCIIDFKFFIEGICSGLIWRLQPVLEKESTPSKLQDLRSAYGNLLELYFRELLHNIFGLNREKSEGGKGADAIIRFKNYSLIFEFTVEHYQISSLYGSTLDSLHGDLNKILFNVKNKKKKDPGKFIKLNTYIKNEQDACVPPKEIIPILVTEKYLGDYELLQESGFDLDKKIQDSNLTNLEGANRPLIIGLDELEIFWAYANADKTIAIQEFIDCINKWREKRDKGNVHYSFGNFLHELFGGANNKRETNKHYLEFFNFKSLFEDVKKHNKNSKRFCRIIQNIQTIRKRLWKKITKQNSKAKNH